MRLDNEIDKRSKEVSTDAYAMSVGEIVSLYKDKELNIHPEFQRYFRWSDEQKSRFIESLLLGIPIPSIFVSQDKNGNWDLVDGLQRLSTILQLMGELTDAEDKLISPLILKKTKYLSSLEGKRWVSDSLNKEDELSSKAKLIIKRARIDIKIVLNKSDKSAKYELFDRLNTGGAIATDQEVRNCILLMINKNFFEWLSALGKDANFQSCIPLTERQLEEQYDLELVVRFLVLKRIEKHELRKIGELGHYLTDKISEFAQSSEYDLESEGESFRKTFEFLARYSGEESFKKYNFEKKRVQGPFLISLFEVIAIGIGYHCLNKNFALTQEKLLDIQKSLWKNELFINGTGSGIGPISRIPVTIPLGQELFVL